MAKERALLFIFLGIFFVLALRDLSVEAKRDLLLFKNLSGLDDGQKRTILIGDLSDLVNKCRREIPEGASALVITDTPNDGLFLAYHLSPLRLYFEEIKDVREEPPEISELDPAWVEKHNIGWVIFRFSRKTSKNTVEKMLLR